MSIPLSTLDTLTVATPCNVPWSGMQGDDRSRFCGECRRPVFDFAAMTTAEVIERLADPAGRPCVRLFRRPDGRVMTADCPVGLRGRVWRWVRRRASWAASLFALLFLPSCRTTTLGVLPDAYSAAVRMGPPSQTLSTPPQEQAASPQEPAIPPPSLTRP